MLTRSERMQQSHGVRRRHRGRMVMPNGQPRASNQSDLPKRHGVKCKGGQGGGRGYIYECGQSQQDAVKNDTRNLPGKYKVSLPHGRTKYVRPGGCPR